MVRWDTHHLLLHKAEGHTSISAAIPPFPVQISAHFSWLKTHSTVYLPQRLPKQEMQSEAERPDGAHEQTLTGLWHLPHGHQHLGQPWVPSWGQTHTLPAWLSTGDPRDRDCLGCRVN